MKYDHLKLRVLDGEFKYVLVEDTQSLQALLQAPSTSPMALFRSQEEISAIVPSEVECVAKKTEDGWIGLRIIGEMPFGTVQGLIAEISNILAGQGMGLCVVSTFLTDWFFVKTKNKESAITHLEKAGWKFT